MTMLGIHFKLKRQFLKDYKGHFTDDYKGQNKALRKAEIYANENVVDAWRNQWRL